MLVEGFQAGLHSGENVARKVEFDWNKVSHSNRVDHTTIHWNRFTLQEKRDVLVWAVQCGGWLLGRTDWWTGSGSEWAAQYSTVGWCSGRSVLRSASKDLGDLSFHIHFVTWWGT